MLRAIFLYSKESLDVARDQATVLCSPFRNSSSIYNGKENVIIWAVLCENSVQTSETLKREDSKRGWIHKNSLFFTFRGQAKKKKKQDSLYLPQQHGYSGTMG